MSEYQYYEFQAIDTPLSTREMAQLRAYSTRAKITPTLFVNEYHWGNFKGDEDAWMERYFDAFLYFANWRTRVLKIRLPSESLGLGDIDPFAGYDAFSAFETDGKVILSFVSQDEDGYDYDDGADSETLSSILPVRAGLQRGDYRSLYIGWLLAVQSGEVGPDDVEPPVPAGLGNLDASLEALVSFLRIDEDLLEVAAETSAPMLAVMAPNERDVMDWLAKLSTVEKDKWLARLCVEHGATITAEVQRRFRNDHAPKGKRRASPKRRTADDLLRAAETRADERERLAEKEAAAEAERRRLQAERERTRHLNTLVGQENRLWSEVEKLVTTTLPKNYDAAVQIMQDLRDLATRTGNDEFAGRLNAFRTAHSRKPTLLERVSKANL